jgi:hypothetical protein
MVEKGRRCDEEKNEEIKKVIKDRIKGIKSNNEYRR